MTHLTQPVKRTNLAQNRAEKPKLCSILNFGTMPERGEEKTSLRRKPFKFRRSSLQSKAQMVEQGNNYFLLTECEVCTG